MRPYPNRKHTQENLNTEEQHLCLLKAYLVERMFGSGRTQALETSFYGFRYHFLPSGLSVAVVSSL